MVHEDAEIIAEEGPSDSKLPGGGDNENLTESNEHGGDDDVQGFGKELYVWLLCDSIFESSEKNVCVKETRRGVRQEFVQAVPEHAGEKDRRSEEITSISWVPTENLRDRLVFIL